MIKSGNVFSNNELVGSITKEKNMYSFVYADDYYNNSSKKAISISFPKTKKEFQSPILFPFFFNMLSEGTNKHLQCRMLKIDENDYFGLLLATANSETIGAITVKPKEFYDESGDK